jgi:hypothetical protein
MATKSDEFRVGKSASFKAERKTITVEAKRNGAGTFVRIIELTENGRRDMVCIPLEGIPELVRALGECL